MNGFKEEEDQPLELRPIIIKYLRNWYLFAIGIVCCVALGFLYLRISTPLYSVTSTILIKDDDLGSDMTKNIVYSDLERFYSSSNVENEIGVLKSRTLMHKVVSELPMFTSYFVDAGFLKKRELYGEQSPIQLIVKEFDSTAFYDELEPIKIRLNAQNTFEIEKEKRTFETYYFGEEIALPYTTFSVHKNQSFPENIADTSIVIEASFNYLPALAESLSDGLEVELVNKRASTVSIAMLTSVPSKGVDIINKLVELYNEEALQDKNQMAINTIDFIDDRLKYITTELSDVERNVERYKGIHDITNVDSEAQLYLQSSTDYIRQLAEVEIEIDVLESLNNHLQSQQDRYQSIPSSLTIANATFNTLVDKYNEMQLERERMIQNYLPSNPLILNINKQLDNLRSDILQNLAIIKKSLEITRDNLQSSSSQIRSKAQRVPRIERELLEISRQQGIKQEHYLYLLKKREEAAIMLSANSTAKCRVIDPAFASFRPAKPKSLFVLFAAAVMGVILPFGYVLITDILNDKVQHREDVERITKIPVLGEISHSKKTNSLTVNGKKHAPIVEQFRLVRSNFNFATTPSRNKILLVTSSRSGEGKTFFALNMGISLHKIGRKVVVVEFDLRKPALLKSLSIENKVGISNFLIKDDVLLPSIIHKIEDKPDLCVIGSGPIPFDPAELMASEKVGNLVRELKLKYDHVILDTAPIGQVADAYALAPYVDVLLYVVRYNYTLKNHLKIINEITKSKKFPSPLIVLNDARKSNLGDNMYGYGYE